MATIKRKEIDAFVHAGRDGDVDKIVAWLEGKDRATVNTQGWNGYTALMMAAANGSEASARLLVDKYGADLGIEDEQGLVALSWACRNGHAEIARYLLASGADPNTRDRNGWTPLLYAALQGHLHAIKALLESGADPNAIAHDGRYALSLAKDRRNIDVIKFLLAHSADLEPQGSTHDLVREAAQENLFDLCRLFLRNGTYVPQLNACNL